MPASSVREHPAPLGALRRQSVTDQDDNRTVREHPALLRHQLTTSRADHGDQLKGLEQAGT